MKLKQTITIAALLAANTTQLLAASQDDELQLLKQQLHALEEKVRSLEKNAEQATQKPESQAAATTKAPASSFKMSDWVSNVKLQGDLRVRYDGIYAPDDSFVTRDRVRPRLRFGAIFALKDDWELGFRLASTPTVGRDTGGDPLSTNQTFEDNASRKPIGIDQAYARWSPIHTAQWSGSFAAGKMENPPNYSENVFDVDYTPEGFAEQFSYKANANNVLGIYLGQYVLDEQQFSSKDPLLFLEQLHLDTKWDQHISSGFTLSGLNIIHPETLTTTNVPDSNHGNTRDANGVLLNDYRVMIADGKLTYNVDSFPHYHGSFPISLSGEYIHNFGAARDNKAYSVGLSFGRVPATGQVIKGNWEFSWRYQELQGDANYEELTASDNGAFYRSRPLGEPYGTFRPTFLNGLNLRGHALRLATAPTDSLVIDTRLWLNEPINESPTGDVLQGSRLLLDFVWKL